MTSQDTRLQQKLIRKYFVMLFMYSDKHNVDTSSLETLLRHCPARYITLTYDNFEYTKGIYSRLVLMRDEGLI